MAGGSSGRGEGILDAARRRLGLSNGATWALYFGVGGNGTPAELEAWLAGASPMPSHDHDVLAHALNEVFHERGEDHPLAYRRDG